jgi:hypothetical protein
VFLSLHYAGFILKFRKGPESLQQDVLTRFCRLQAAAAGFQRRRRWPAGRCRGLRGSEPALRMDCRRRPKRRRVRGLLPGRRSGHGECGKSRAGNGAAVLLHRRWQVQVG